MNARAAMTSANDDRPVVDANPVATPMDGRMLLSSLAAAVAPGLLFMLLFMMPALVLDSRSGEEWLFACLLAGLATLIALGHVAVLGIPYVLVLLKIGRFRWLPMVAGGFAIGFLPTLCFTLLPYLFEHSSTGFSGGSGMVLVENVRLPLSAGGFGALSALVFHIVFRWLSRGRVETAVRSYST